MWPFDTNEHMGIVYSSDHGRMCPKCKLPAGHCICDERGGRGRSRTRASDGFVRVGRETKGRKGKGVTVVTGLPLGGPELADLARKLKKRCGSGGTVRDGVIEVQGEHRDTLCAELERLGYRVKRVGG